MAEQISSLKTSARYKDTPIGKIPVDWSLKKLIDAASEEKYSFAGGPFRSDLKEDSYTDHGVRIIQLQNIGDGNFLDEYKIFTSDEKADQLRHCNIYPGDIIIAKMADPVARACIIPDKDKRYLMASDGIRLSVNQKKYDVNFILYLINSPYFRKNAEKHSTGTTRLRIGLSELKNLPIAVPPIEDQKKIAEILTTVDDAIEKTGQIIEKTKEAKKGLMQKLLTRGLECKKFKKTEIGEIPEGWEVLRLKNIAIKFLNGGTPDTSNQNYWDGQIPWITGADFENQKINQIRRHITNEGLKNSATNIIPKGNLLVVTRTGVGKIALAPFDIAISQDITGIILDSKKALPEFLYWYFDYNGSKLKSIIQGTSISGLLREDLESFIVPLPSIVEQKKIADILSSIDEEIEKESKHKDHLESLKKGLMQVLLTGKIHVSL